MGRQTFGTADIAIASGLAVGLAGAALLAFGMWRLSAPHVTMRRVPVSAGRHGISNGAPSNFSSGVPFGVPKRIYDIPNTTSAKGRALAAGHATGRVTVTAAGNSSARQYAHTTHGYSIFHPPPVASSHLSGLLNRRLSFPARFVMSMAASPGGQTVALATEGQGLVMFRPAASPPHRWVTFHPSKQGTGFPSWNNYAVCFDSNNRLWVGTLRKGVVVGMLGRHGWQWRHYDEIARPARAINPNLPHEGNMTFNGPIGCHVFAMAENPVDKSLCISTEAGLSVYYPRGAGIHHAIAAGSLQPQQQLMQAATGKAMLFGRWRYVTQANGLPSSPVDCMALDSTGNLFAGTQCNGIAMARPMDGYQHWRIIKGAKHVTATPTGTGLPSNLINAILVTPDQHIYAATDWGLGISDDDGSTWHYIRGQDYAAKVAQLWHVPKNWQAPDPESLKTLLPGDHITCLAQDPKGRIWIGTWRNGYAIYQPGHGVVYASKLKPGAWRHGGDYVNAFLPVQLDSLDSVGLGSQPRVMLVGRYGGRPTVGWAGGKNTARTVRQTPAIARFPAAAQPPTQMQLAQMLQHLEKAVIKPTAKQAAAEPTIIPLPDDWRTQGSWLGRYGRYWACLYACLARSDYVWAPSSGELSHHEILGPHNQQSDATRYWMQWLATTQNRSMELPQIYLQQAAIGEIKTDRRESEVDDHGEVYPVTWQGPDLFLGFRIPEGIFRLSLYIVSPNGHTSRARQRDIVISSILKNDSFHFVKGSRYNLASVAKASGVARVRVADFYNGVWKRFLVRGPMKLAIHLSRNYSINALVSGVALDALAEFPAPYYSGYSGRRHEERDLSKPREQRFVASASGPKLASVHLSEGGSTPATDRAVARSPRLLSAIDRSNPFLWSPEGQLVCVSTLRGLLAAHRASAAYTDAGPAAETCYYQLGLYRRWEYLERSRGLMTSRQIEKGLRWNGVNSSYSGLEFRTIRQSLRKSHEAVGLRQDSILAGGHRH